MPSIRPATAPAANTRSSNFQPFGPELVKAYEVGAV